MEPSTVVIASATVTAGYFVGGIALRLALAALRRLVRRTRTKVDDRILDELEDYLTEHPEAVGQVMDLLKKTPVR